MGPKLATENRRQDWEEILNIAEGLRGLDLEETSAPLKIDSQIYPRFPSQDLSAQRLLQATNRSLSPALLSFFQTKCTILQEQTLIAYKTAVANLGSILSRTGIDDRDQQTRLSDGFEKWYAQSEAEMISAIKESLPEKVSRISLPVISACLVRVIMTPWRAETGERRQHMQRDGEAAPGFRHES